MNGRLNKQPLAELIREISLQRLAGTLRLQHEAVKAVVYFEAGEIIYAASNLRELRLSEYLMKQGLVSVERLTSLGNNQSDLSLVSALSANGIVNRERIAPLIASQVTDLLRVILLWTKGKWEWDERTHLGDPVRVKLQVPDLLLRTARRMQLQFVASRFPDPDELITPAAGMPDFNRLLPAEGFVLSRLDGPVRLNELIALSGLRELDARRTIYGLALGGFLERQHWPSALQSRPEAVPSKSVHPTQGGMAKAEVVSTPVEIAGQSDAAELHELFAKLDKAESHYEVLNVEATAGAAEIKRSYYSLARRYHPDRFHMQAGTELHMRIESAFARIAQAYLTLGDAALRSSYDVKLASRERVRQFAQDAPRAHPAGSARTAASENTGGNSSAGGDWERAEDSFQEGFAALQQGQTKLAITNLAAAARIAPQEARFRAYYGRALAAVEDTRRLAEAEMQAAIRLDPENSSYRVMLAELYCDLGFFRRAEGELKRVTSREPNNPAVRKLMRKLEAARTAT